MGHKVNNPKGKGENKDQNGVKLFRNPFFGSPFFGFPAVIAQIHDCCDKQSPEHKNYSVEGVGDRNDQIEDEKKIQKLLAQTIPKIFQVFHQNLLDAIDRLTSFISFISFTSVILRVHHINRFEMRKLHHL